MPANSIVSFAVAAMLALPLAVPSAALGQGTNTAPKWEFKAVAFGEKESEATQKLNDLVKDGWQYVGPLGKGLVAFRRPAPGQGGPEILTAREEKQLGQLVEILKKDEKYGPKELKEYQSWYRSISTQSRNTEFASMTRPGSPDPNALVPLSEQEEKEFKELVEIFRKKMTFSAMELKQYGQWYREQSHEERAREYLREGPKKKGGDDR